MRKGPRVVQPILGLVASDARPLSPSQRELVRRAGTHLSIQQRQTARRQARSAEAEDRAKVQDPQVCDDVAALFRNAVKRLPP